MVATAAQLVSSRIVTGTVTQRLVDVAAELRAVGAHHCVVLAEETPAFVGLIRLEDLASCANSGNRILADLVSSIRPISVRSGEDANALASMFERHGIYEAVVLEPDGAYVGLITAESFAQWSIREQRRMQTLVAQRDERLKMAANLVGLGVFQWNIKSDQVVWENDEMFRIFGRTGEEGPLGVVQFLNEVADPDDGRLLKQELDLKVVTGGTLHAVCRFRRASDHSARTLRLAGRFQRNAQGLVDRLVGVVVDITEQQQADEALRQARLRLEHALQVKDNFIAALSHELRTPLTPALLLASAGANDFRLPEKAREDFQSIANAVSVEARLLGDLLDFVDDSRSALLLDTRNVRVDDVIREAVAAAEPDAKEKNVTLRMSLNAPEFVIAGDELRLRRAFGNILNNAVKFSPRNDVVQVESKLAADDGTIVVTISDHGVGLDFDELQLVFEPFVLKEYSARGAAPRFGGLGLGLAIARSIVEMHSGEINITSPGRDQGATVVLSLPKTISTASSGNS